MRILINPLNIEIVCLSSEWLYLAFWTRLNTPYTNFHILVLVREVIFVTVLQNLSYILFLSNTRIWHKEFAYEHLCWQGCKNLLFFFKDTTIWKLVLYNEYVLSLELKWTRSWRDIWGRVRERLRKRRNSVGEDVNVLTDGLDRD